MPAAVTLESGVTLSDDAAESLINAARVFGGDWLEAAGAEESSGLAEKLDLLEDGLEQRFRAAVQRKQDENSDRAMFQLHGLDQHLRVRLRTMEATMQRHVEFKRPGLVKATQGSIDKLKARMEMRREQILRQQRITPSNHFVCCGLIEVVGD